MPHFLPSSSGTPFSSCIESTQIGLKNLIGSLSLAFLGTVTLLTSLCSRIYGVFACQIVKGSCNTAGGHQARGRSLKLRLSSKPSGNVASSLPQTPSSPSPIYPPRPVSNSLSIPSYPPSALSHVSEERELTMGPGPLIRKIISFASFKKGSSDEETPSYVDRGLKRGVSFLDMSVSTYPGPSPHRVSPSAMSSASCQTLVGSASSCTTLSEHTTSDMPYREGPCHTDFSPQMHKSGVYPRRPSRTEDDDEHTIHVVPIHGVRPSHVSSPRSPVHFHNPFAKTRQAPTRQKPRPRRNPKLALTLGEFFSSRNSEHETPTKITNLHSPMSMTNPHDDGTPFPPRNSIRFPPRRYSRTSSYIPARRGSHPTLPHRASSPEPAIESLPVPPSWRRPRQSIPIDMSPTDDEPTPIST